MQQNKKVIRSTEHLLGFALRSNVAWTNYGEQQLSAALDFGVLGFVHEHFRIIETTVSIWYTATVRGTA